MPESVVKYARYGSEQALALEAAGYEPFAVTQLGVPELATVWYRQRSDVLSMEEVQAAARQMLDDNG